MGETIVKKETEIWAHGDQRKKTESKSSTLYFQF